MLVVKTLASDQCGLDSSPSLSTICGLRLLLVSFKFSVVSGFSLGNLFLPVLKHQHAQIPILSVTYFHYWNWSHLEGASFISSGNSEESSSLNKVILSWIQGGVF